MSASKFTPGPWEWDSGVEPPDGPERFANITANDGDTVVAEFNDLIPEARANASLICAAPDLLAALKIALRYMHTCLGSPQYDGPEPYSIIKAAIQKAEP